MHDHHHTAPNAEDRRNLTVAFWLNFSFALVEVAGGLYANSLAVLSDALHDMGDSLALGLAWYFQRLSERGRDARFTYGYRRFTLLGAFLNFSILLVGSTLIVWRAAPALFAERQVNAPAMLAMAVLGLAVNGAAVLRLRKSESVNLKAVTLHLLEDVLGWAAVLVGSAAVYFTGWHVIDPALALLITLYVLYNAARGLTRIMSALMQRVPEGVDVEAAKRAVLRAPGVRSLHDLHLWTMDEQYNVCSVHLVLEEGADPAETKKAVRANLAEAGLEHATLETERPGEECPFNDGDVLRESLDKRPV